jgi:hypothetical protein
MFAILYPLDERVHAMRVFIMTETAKHWFCVLRGECVYVPKNQYIKESCDAKYSTVLD